MILKRSERPPYAHLVGTEWQLISLRAAERCDLNIGEFRSHFGVQPSHASPAFMRLVEDFAKLRTRFFGVNPTAELIYPTFYPADCARCPESPWESQR